MAEDEKYVQISHSPPGWHVRCNKTEFMFPQNLNTFLAPERNLNKKRSDTGEQLAGNECEGTGPKNTKSASFHLIVVLSF